MKMYLLTFDLDCFFSLWMQDNGRGMPHDDIPNMLGRGKS